MVNENLQALLEIEYSFGSGGHNSLKLMDGRLFFFSEADSHLTEKNQYMTMVTVPENSVLKGFWDDVDRLGVWGWENNYGVDVDVNETAKVECMHEEEHEHCKHDHHNGDSSYEDINSETRYEIPQNAEIWQVKLIHGPQRVFYKNWSSAPESKDEFFNAVKRLVGIDICLPFSILSQKLSYE